VQQEQESTMMNKKGLTPFSSAARQILLCRGGYFEPSQGRQGLFWQPDALTSGLDLIHLQSIYML